nr:choice-of-anchor L domain-containing protein [uncultured Flavobacterium sp.]
MKSLGKKIFYILLCCNFYAVQAQYITVDDSKTAQELVSELIPNNSCVTVSGEKISGDTSPLTSNSFGFFNQNGSSFSFSEGIVLSTWSSEKSVGPFISINKGDSEWTGDSDLESALGLVSNTTYNATALEFDFVPTSSFISFDYIFASNEYQYDFPCKHSDGFAFLIKDITVSPNTPYTNIAKLPNDTPVSSFTIHPTISYTDSFGINTSCLAENEAFFGQLNTNPTNSSPINYSGQTKVLNAQTTVIPNNKYHIKLVLADSDSKYWNSAVFLKAGSFLSKIDLGINRLLTTNNPICYGDSFLINTNLTDPSYSFKWFKNGNLSPILGETSASLLVTNAGNYSVEVTNSNGCITFGEIKIEYSSEIKTTDINLQKCVFDENKTAVFDLTKAEEIIKSIDTKLNVTAYYETKTGETLSNQILNPNLYNKIPTSDQTVYALVKNIFDCSRALNINLHTLSGTQVNSTNAKSPIITEFSGNENSVELIPPSGGGNFEFSLDGMNYQVNPLFLNVPMGNYNAYIKNSETCEYLSFPVTVLDYPRFFTPNGDNYNDYWKINNLDLYPNTTLFVYNRFGKLLKQLSPSGDGWDGTFNGLNLPSDDYWFTLNLEGTKEYKGHFSLKR